MPNCYSLPVHISLPLEIALIAGKLAKHSRSAEAGRSRPTADDLVGKPSAVVGVVGDSLVSKSQNKAIISRRYKAN